MTQLTAAWLEAPASVAVMGALGEAFYVGGCVRNALLGAPVADIDVATPLSPERVIERLEAAGLRAIPTGIAHGTVTAVHDGVPVEVTTFRRDVQTDGRHAVVAFTTRMIEDARRRDFTMNALYADASGRVVDPIGGVPDLEAGRVRFIGPPDDRICEDYLRILRFFRFSAWFARTPQLDAAGLAGIARHVDGLARLARERVGAEVRKLLCAPDPARAIRGMEGTGVLASVLPGANADGLAKVLAIEAGRPVDWLLRLAALGAEAPAEALRLSNEERNALTALERAGAMSVAEGAYRHGADAARQAAILKAAEADQTLPADLDADIARGAQARMPLSASDLMAQGIAPGPGLGEALRQAEDAWIESGFTLDRAALLALCVSPTGRADRST